MISHGCKQSEMFLLSLTRMIPEISVSVSREVQKIFIKVAGIATAESIRTKEEAIASLKSAMSVYETITHPHLIELIDHGSLDDLYISVFKWTSGDCLFDHWNFEKYDNNPQLIPPAKRFSAITFKEKNRCRGSSVFLFEYCF